MQELAAIPLPNYLRQLLMFKDILSILSKFVVVIRGRCIPLIFIWLMLTLYLSLDYSVAQTAPSSLPTLEPLGVWEVVSLPGNGAYHIADFFGNMGWMF